MSDGQKLRADAGERMILERLRATHRVWLSAKSYQTCDCPFTGDHNPSAWRSGPALSEIGCRCDRTLAAQGIHDSFACPLGFWIGPLGARPVVP